jgi:hypothetical protein
MHYEHVFASLVKLDSKLVLVVRFRLTRTHAYVEVQLLNLNSMTDFSEIRTGL